MCVCVCTVVAKFPWKLSRWPFQKTIAVKLDALQCKIVCYLIKFKWIPSESLDAYCRRRATHVRNLCQELSSWSELRAKRVIDWSDHIQRGGMYNHICNPLIKLKNEQWLTHERAKWVAVSASNSRNTPLAGRTGTRCNIGRPQPRWESSVGLAKQVLASRNVTGKGNNSMSIGTRIRNALVSLTSLVQNRSND